MLQTNISIILQGIDDLLFHAFWNDYNDRLVFKVFHL